MVVCTEQGYTLSATLPTKKSLIAKINVGTGGWAFGEYEGDYVVESSTNEQTLNTKDKLMKSNLTVKALPYSETSNTGNGITVFIGKESEL